MPGVLGRKQEYLTCGSCGWTIKARKLARHMKLKHTHQLVAPKHDSVVYITGVRETA